MDEQNFWDQYGDDILGEAEKAAQEGLVRSSFGELTLSNRYYFFSGSPETGWGVEDCDLETYQARMKDQKLRRSTGLDLVFSINVQEFNPSLEFTYERKVRVGQADWTKTLVPSIEAVFGKGSMGAKKRGKTMGALNGAYVEVHAVPQQPKKNDKHINAETGEAYKTVKLARVFASKDECYAVYVETFGEPDLSLPAFPKSYGDVETWETIKSESVTPKVKELLDGGMKEEAVVKMVAKEFGVKDGFVQAIVDDVVPI